MKLYHIHNISANNNTSAGNQNPNTSGGVSVGEICVRPDANGYKAPIPLAIVSNKTKSIITSPTQGSIPNFNVCTYTTKVPQTPSSAPPIPILISTDEDDKTLKDIFFSSEFSSDISVVTAVQQQQVLSLNKPPSSVIVSRQEGDAPYFRNSSSPASIAKHLQSLRPVLCPVTLQSNSNKMEDPQEGKLNNTSASHHMTPSPTSQNEFRISQLKIVSNDTSSSVVSCFKETAVFERTF